MGDLMQQESPKIRGNRSGVTWERKKTCNISATVQDWTKDTMTDK